eukprot:768486-Hanusia_phi.AAC.4
MTNLRNFEHNTNIPADSGKAFVAHDNMQLDKCRPEIHSSANHGPIEKGRGEGGGRGRGKEGMKNSRREKEVHS